MSDDDRTFLDELAAIGGGWMVTITLELPDPDGDDPEVHTWWGPWRFAVLAVSLALARHTREGWSPELVASAVDALEFEPATVGGYTAAELRAIITMAVHHYRRADLAAMADELAAIEADGDGVT